MSEKVLMKGNEALAEAAIRSGCKHFFGYPITPQTELAAYMAKRLPKIGGTYLQAESEIAAVNMVQGAGAAGIRAMTSSSSPGVSLKAEGISYMAGADVPAVIINVQRGGPGLGGIQPSQADYWQATRAMGHGDFHIFVFAPSTVQEMVDLVSIAFDRADKYRMPAMILADGMLGQMMEPVTFDNMVAPDIKEKPWALTGHRNKRKHNVINSLFLTADELESKVDERFERYEIIKNEEQRCDISFAEDADIMVVSYGATARVVQAAVKEARAEGIKVGCFRPITLWPFPEKALRELAKTTKAFLTVEMSKGQMIDDVKLAIECSRTVEFYGRTGGIIPEPSEILEKIREMAGGLK